MSRKNPDRQGAVRERELIAKVLAEHPNLTLRELMPLTGLSAGTLSVRLNTMKSGQVVSQSADGTYRLVVAPMPEHYPAMVRRWFGYPTDTDRRPA